MKLAARNMMRRFVSIAFALLFLLSAVSFTNWNVQAMPTESRALLQEAPSLAGKNIYFSETFKESSQFDRSDAGISRYAGLLRLMGANLFTLEWRKGIPATADLIVITGPTTDLSQDAAARLWAYIQRGGRVLLLVDAVDDRGNASRALPGTKGLFDLTWSDLGLHAQDDVVVVEGETRTVDVTETDREGNVTAQYSVESPELSLNFETSLINDNHPITAGLSTEAAAASEEDAGAAAAALFTFSGARSLEIDGSLQNQVVTPLIFVDQPNIYGESNYATYVSTNGAVEYNIGSDTARGPLILAAAMENPTVGSRIVLIGDANFIRNGLGFNTSPGYSGGFIHPAHARFMIQATAWLLGATAPELEFPTPAATSTPTITPSPTLVPSPTPDVTVTPAA